MQGMDVAFPRKVILSLLAAVLATACVGAATAQASPVWHVKGKTLQQSGIATLELKAAGGPVSISYPGLEISITCSGLTGTGSIAQSGAGQVDLSLSGCQNGPNCQVEPIALKASITPVEIGGKRYLHYTESDPFLGMFHEPWGQGEYWCGVMNERWIDGSFAAELDPEVKEAVELTNAATLDSAEATESYLWTNGGEVGYLDGSWGLTISSPASLVGSAFGAW